MPQYSHQVLWFQGLPIAGDFTYSDILKRYSKTSNTILDHITVNLIMSPIRTKGDILF
jgi:hypothetical protein